MSVASQVKRIAAQNSEAQPLIKNNFKIRFPFGHGNEAFESALEGILLSSDQIRTAFSILSTPDAYSVPYESDFSPPTLSGEVRTARRHNFELKYAGFGEFSNASLSLHLYDPTFVHFNLVKNFFISWYLVSYGLNPKQPFNFLDSDVIQLGLANKRRDTNVNNFNYRHNCFVDHYSQRSSYPAVMYKLVNVWPQKISFDNLDNSDTGDNQQMNIDFSVDAALPQGQKALPNTDVGETVAIEQGFSERQIDKIRTLS